MAVCGKSVCVCVLALTIYIWKKYQLKDEVVVYTYVARKRTAR